jgi:hypothetical protein
MFTSVVPAIADSNSAFSASGFITGSIIGYALYVIALWRIFAKAGQPGWAALIPIYNWIVLLRVIGRPWWWWLLLLIPIVNVIVLIIIDYELAKSFGHGVGFTIGLIFLQLIFLLILAFGSSQYRGSVGPEGTANPAMAS